MTAAVRDHGGGEGAAPRMVMSWAGEITPPTRQIGLSATAIGVQQQAAIAAAHHAVARGGPGAPSDRGVHAKSSRGRECRVVAEQGAGDLAMRGAGKPAVEPAQGEDETIAPGWRKGTAGLGPDFGRLTRAKAGPRRPHGFRTDGQTADEGRGLARRFDVHAERCLAVR